MISVEEADKIIFRNIRKLPAVRVSLPEAFGMVLREDLLADRDIPPFDRVMMDGIGISFASWEKGNRVFPIDGIQKAGIPPVHLVDAHASLEVMTGAVLPVGCDCVIPYEDIEIKDGKARLRQGVELRRLQYVHSKASDHARGARLVRRGERLFAPQVAVAASVGKAEVLVSMNPSIAVVGTGDEVVGIHEQVEPYQIRQSNVYVIEAALKLSGYDRVTRFHIRDDQEELSARLKQILEDFDVLVLSGGVSMGKLDFVPEALCKIGVKALFHQVKQRPGKPFWFGKGREDKPVFALPGNPVSTQVGVYRYVLPYLSEAVDARAAEKEFAVLREDIDVKTDRAYFLPVKVESREDGRLLAAPVFPNVSGDYAALARTDGFVELPADTFRFAKGTTARLFRWKV